jgi:plasmid replication initiation protein
MIKFGSSLVVKSNRLIEASYRLSMVEQQLLLMAIAQSRIDGVVLSSDKPVTIKVVDFVAMFGSDRSHAYKQLRDALDSLFDRYVFFNDVDGDGEPWSHKMRWISRYSYADGIGSIKIIFSADVIPYLTKLEEEFTVYRIQQIGNLRSVYAVRMYELLLQFKSTGIRYFEIKKLRDILGLIDEYQLFANLKAKVLDVAVSQINEHTDIKVKYETRKTGRKITHLDFKIKDKSEVPKRLIINDDLIKKHARPGETTEQVRERLRKERDAKTSTQPR